jgi:ATP adenylyltransferase
MHVLPRWTADSNFMTAVSETRVLPEALDTTYERLKSAIG